MAAIPAMTPLLRPCPSVLPESDAAALSETPSDVLVAWVESLVIEET